MLVIFAIVFVILFAIMQHHNNNKIIIHLWLTVFWVLLLDGKIKCLATQIPYIFRISTYYKILHTVIHFNIAMCSTSYTQRFGLFSHQFLFLVHHLFSFIEIRKELQKRRARNWRKCSRSNTIRICILFGPQRISGWYQKGLFQFCFLLSWSKAKR